MNNVVHDICLAMVSTALPLPLVNGDHFRVKPE